jgi:hypothetical protein
LKIEETTADEGEGVTKPKLSPEKALFIFLWHCTLLRGSYTSSSSFIYFGRISSL